MLKTFRGRGPLLSSKCKELVMFLSKNKNCCKLHTITYYINKTTTNV